MCGVVGTGVTQMGNWIGMESHTLGSQDSWGHLHRGLNTLDHVAWGMDIAGVTQIGVWIHS